MVGIEFTAEFYRHKMFLQPKPVKLFEIGGGKGFLIIQAHGLSIVDGGASALRVCQMTLEGLTAFNQGLKLRHAHALLSKLG